MAMKTHTYTHAHTITCTYSIIIIKRPTSWAGSSFLVNPTTTPSGVHKLMILLLLWAFSNYGGLKFGSCDRAGPLLGYFLLY